MKVKLEKVRASYLNAFEARAFEDQTPKFSGSFLFDPESANAKKVRKAMRTVAEEKWGSKADEKSGEPRWKVILTSLEKKGKVCLRDGDDKEDDGYEGMLYVSASNKRRPKVVDVDGETPLVEADGKPYSGCHVNVYVDIWAMDNKFGKRICAQLGGIQFHSDGDPFTSSGEPEDFDALGDGDEPDDEDDEEPPRRSSKPKARGRSRDDDDLT